MLLILTGKEVHLELSYFSDDGELTALRYNDWLEEQLTTQGNN